MMCPTRPRLLGYLFCILAQTLFGCSKHPDDLARERGFANAEEMAQFKAKGFETRENYNNYLQSLLPTSGCANVNDLEKALQQQASSCLELQARIQREAEEVRLKAEMAAKEEALKNKFKQGIDYVYYDDGSCRGGDKVCIDHQEYRYLCGKSDGASKWAANLAIAYSNEEAKHLYDNGGLTNLQVAWSNEWNTRDGNVGQCRLRVVVEGIYKGSTTRKVIDARVTGFLLTKDNKVLVSGAVAPEYDIR